MTDLTNVDDDYTYDVTKNYTINALAGNDKVKFIGAPLDYDENYTPPAPYTVTANGGTGDDTLGVQGQVDQVLLYGGDGNDLLYDTGEYEFIDVGTHAAYGGAGDDVISGFLDAFGEDGNDTIYGGGSGGAGDDYLESTEGLGGAGSGGDGSDILVGGGNGDAGDDIILYNEELNGGDGSDYLYGGYYGRGGAGNDLMRVAFGDGGAGHDVWFGVFDSGFVAGEDKFSTSEDYFVVSAFTGRENEVVSTSETTYFDFDGDGVADYDDQSLTNLRQADFLHRAFDASVENTRDKTAHTASGTALNEFFYGGYGDDTLSGAGGLDYLFGGFGKDSLSGNSGDDLLVGNAGDDHLYGGSGDDELDGGDGDDTLSGSEGNDYAYAGTGNDVLSGGEGNDRLLGETGDDRVNGGNGDDILVGGKGADFLIGGAGADIFVFAAGDSSATVGGRDRISDFASGVDKIDLAAFVGASVSITAGSAYDLLSIDAGNNGSVDSVIVVEVVGSGHLLMADLLI